MSARAGGVQGPYKDIGDDEELQFASDAYVMYHQMRGEWPCLPSSGGVRAAWRTAASS